VATQPDGDYLTLVVRLQMGADGTWYVYVDGTKQFEALPLTPVTFVVRLWQHSSTGIVRGSIRLHDSDQWAPIQSNARLEDLIRAWLLPGDHPPSKS
jgi:hypothetical protein